MDIEKIKKVLSDEEFVKSLLNFETPQQVQQALKDKGVELSIDEITSVGDLLNRYLSNELTDQEKKVIELVNNSGDELNEEELESVAGGFVMTTVGVVCALIGTIIVGTGVTVGTGFYVHRVFRGRW